jgi:hypothetical protein
MVPPLLALIGDVYLPFLVANEAAVSAGADSLRITAMGENFSQPPFRYQVKCLHALRAAHATLAGEPRARVDAALAEAGCLEALSTTG